MYYGKVGQLPNSWGAYPAPYAGASHVRYLVPQAPNGQHSPAPSSAFMSASGRGAHAWSSPSHSQPLEPAEKELVTFSHRREPQFSQLVSQLEDDPQVSLRCICSCWTFRNVFHVLCLYTLLNKVLRGLKV